MPGRTSGDIGNFRAIQESIRHIIHLMPFGPGRGLSGQNSATMPVITPLFMICWEVEESISLPFLWGIARAGFYQEHYGPTSFQLRRFWKNWSGELEQSQVPVYFTIDLKLPGSFIPQGNRCMAEASRVSFMQLLRPALLAGKKPDPGV